MNVFRAVSLAFFSPLGEKIEMRGSASSVLPLTPPSPQRGEGKFGELKEMLLSTPTCAIFGMIA
jgi:hypothetical protein